MSAPPPPTPVLNTQISLLRTFGDFLTVALHTILFVRSLYPPKTFITTRKYNFPVHQNRHPAVCQWINDSVSSIHDLLLKNTVKRVVIVIFSRKGEVMERYIFDVERFPIIEEVSAWVELESGENDTKGKGKEAEDEPTEHDQDMTREVSLNVSDIEEQLRATIRILEYEGSKKSPLPGNCTYTLAVELRDDPDVTPPLRHPQQWIPTTASLQPIPSLQIQPYVRPETAQHLARNRNLKKVGIDLGGVKSTPVRLVEAGEFVLETWIEEGKAKFSYSPTSLDHT